VDDKTKLKLNSVALVRNITIPTGRPPLVGEVSVNFLRLEDVNLGFLDPEPLVFLSSSSSVILMRLRGPVPGPLLPFSCDLLGSVGSKGFETRRFGNWICFRPRVKEGEDTYSVGSWSKS
jgi:hypothetical protein